MASDLYKINDSKYIGSLDGLRGVGVSLVIVYHALRMKGFDPSVFGFAWVAVQMFFVQSGYLITKILLDKKSLSFAPFIKIFYWNRALRIFPAYFLYLFLLSLIFLLVAIPQGFLKVLPYLLTYTYNFTRFDPTVEFHPFFVHLWSLCVEEQFYLLWPFLIFFLNQRAIKYLIFFLLVACPFLRLGLGVLLPSTNVFDDMQIGEAIYGFTLSHLDAFASGAALAIFNLQPIIKHLKVISVALLTFIVLVLLMNQLSLAEHPGNHWSGLGLPLASLKNYQHVWSYTLVNIGFAVLTLNLLSANYRGMFNNRFFVFVGKFAYSTYIIHFFIIAAIVKIAPTLPIGLVLTAAFLVSHTAGYLSYQLLERKFLKYKIGATLNKTL
jgi:peptidoglycan/LPS O-acetylase OafA/YrhL